MFGKLPSKWLLIPKNGLENLSHYTIETLPYESLVKQLHILAEIYYAITATIN